MVIQSFIINTKIPDGDQTQCESVNIFDGAEFHMYHSEFWKF